MRAIAALGLGLLPWLAGCSADSGPERPNVVLVVLDTTRADVLSSYGNPVPTTPHLDALAQAGTRFTSAFATDFWTLPSHASLLTGEYPSRHQATSVTNRLPSRAETIPEILRRAGYRTAAFISNPWVSAERGFDQGFEVFQEVWRARTGLPPEDRGGLQLARGWIRERAEAEEPFLLFVNFNTAHMPYAPDPDILAELYPEPVAPDRRDHLTKISGLWQFIAGREELDARDFAAMRAFYEGEIAMVDRLVGALVEELRGNDLLEDTLVIITSDHGENIGDHGMIDHLLSMYDTTIRVPLIIRYPALLAGGSVDETLTSLVDIPATILDACGLPRSALEGPGRSLLDPDRAAVPFVIAENERPVNGVELLNRAYPDFDTTPIDRPMRMLRTDRYKLIARGDGEEQTVELFDLQNDPGEQHDASRSLPEVARELSRQLDDWIQRNTVKGSGPRFESRDSESLDQLRALGYIE